MAREKVGVFLFD
jgi:hypothetical protein